MKIFLFLLSFSSFLFSQDSIKFDDFFLNKSLRIDYYHTGDKTNDLYSIDELKEEPYWAGSRTNLIDNFNYGNYKVTILDDSSGKEIFTKTYSTLFHEWQTTDEAKATTKTFSETVVIPYPKNKITAVFYSRDRNNIFHKKFTYKIDPTNYFIKMENDHQFDTLRIQYSGNSSLKIDIAFIPEGYTEAEMESFEEDCRRFTESLFSVSPFKENKNKFNVWAVLAPSEESGSDVPATDQWKKTLLNSSFYTFDEERYIMTSDNKTVRDVAANVPYDQIYILANTDIYGGGAIYNHYSLSGAKNKYSAKVVVHEFGHAFASLADEYSEKDSKYIDFYNLKVEPTDPNLTTLVDFDSKWKDLVEESTPIPTPDIKKYEDKIGAFEGGGYLEKGLYRPAHNCVMRSLSTDEFCEVCKRAIREVINFYSK